MKSVTLSLILVFLVVGTVAADPAPRRFDDSELGPSFGEPLAIAPWATHASAIATDSRRVAPEIDAVSGLTRPRPAILLETDYYVYGVEDLAGFIPDAISVNLTMSANGYVAPVSLYLYWQDRVTGEKQYYNLPTGGFVADGEQKDLFGDDSPIAINPFDATDFQLFGAAGVLGSARTVDPTGRYQWVLEVRNADGSVVISRGNAMYAVVDSLSIVTSNITSNTTWTADNAYVLGSAIFVQEGATLTIEPGTVVFGASDINTVLVVARGGKIAADGTAMQPIIMTTDVPPGQRGSALWGGLILNGRAPINVPGGTAEGEGDTGTYGGGATPDPADSSGVLRYVRVEFAGFEFSPDNELNGIALQGVGSGTVIDHVQVHFNKDDGIEFFGGTANAKYVLLTNIGDDNIDWTEGWTGSLQYVVVVQNGIDADQGLEADNNGDNNDLLPRANPTIFNITMVGGGDDTRGGESDFGMLIREGTAAKIHNSIIMSFGEAQFNFSQQATLDQAAQGNVLIDYNIWYNNGLKQGGVLYETDSEDTEDCPATCGAATDQAFLEQQMTHNRMGVDPGLAAPTMRIQPDVEPIRGSAALDARFLISPPGNGFFDPAGANHAGAVAPGNNWTLVGWATFSDN